MLLYVTFPTQTLFKSTKVQIIGVCMGVEEPVCYLFISPCVCNELMIDIYYFHSVDSGDVDGESD